MYKLDGFSKTEKADQDHYLSDDLRICRILMAIKYYKVVNWIKKNYAK